MTPYIEALLAEREGYVRRKLPKRVEAIDEALREVGFEHKYLSKPAEAAPIEAAAIEADVEKAIVKRAKKRS